MNCWDISGVEGVSQCYFDGGFQLLWERLRIYSGKYLFNKRKVSKFVCLHFIFTEMLEFVAESV